MVGPEAVVASDGVIVDARVASMSASAKTQALLQDASTAGCSRTASDEIVDPGVVEYGRARLAWTVDLAIHHEVLEPHLPRNAESLTADFEPQPCLFVEIRDCGGVESSRVQDVDPYLWNVTVPTMKHT